MSDPTPGQAPAGEVDHRWYATAFDTLYPLVYAHRNLEAARIEADFAMQQLRLDHCGKLMDLCCGGGRHLLHLARYCVELVGLDYSLDLLRIADDHLPDNVLLIRGDMRQLPFEGAFDAVVNFFTSFGYFQTDEENARVPREMSRVLKPGGRFFMDYLNPDHVTRNLTERSERELGDRKIIEQRWIDFGASRVNKRTTILMEGEVESETMESVRMYTLDEMRCVLGESGLAIESVHGDYDGSPCSESSPRMIFVGGKV